MLYYTCRVTLDICSSQLKFYNIEHFFYHIWCIYVNIIKLFFLFWNNRFLFSKLSHRFFSFENIILFFYFNFNFFILYEIYFFQIYFHNFFFVIHENYIILVNIQIIFVVFLNVEYCFFVYRVWNWYIIFAHWT